MPVFGWQEVDQSLLDRESEQIDPVGIVAIPQEARKGESSSTNVDDDVCQRQEARDNKRDGRARAMKATRTAITAPRPDMTIRSFQ